MSYNLRYTGSFDVQQSAEPFLSIKVDIYKKDYVGAEQTIILTGTPVVHEWQDDDPFAPIKGSTCKIGIINDGLAHGWIEGASIFFAVGIIVTVTAGNNYMKEKQFQKLKARQQDN